VDKQDADRARTVDQQQLIDTVGNIIHQTGTPGASVALVLDGRTVFEAGVGFSDLALSTPLSSDAQFYVYSITKLLLATAALQLVEQGRLALDVSAQTYLPALPLATPITVRQLLRHTAGVPDYGSMPAYAEAVRSSPERPWTPEEFLTYTLPSGLTFPPDEGWAYSNVGFLIIRMVLERITGLPLRDVLREQIFAPLGLQGTFVAETLADASVLTPGYSAFFRRDGTVEDVTRMYHPGWVSHGVVISTAANLAHLVDALFAGELLRPEQLAMMLTPVLVPGTDPWFNRPAYGLGVMLDQQSPYGLVAGHGGGGPGYSAAALSFSDVAGQRVTTVALVNQDQPPQGMQIAFTLAVILAGPPA
jgi:D-alanyl-D-alanine carboxypeptidase